jgi:hypothetical protein
MAQGLVAVFNGVDYANFLGYLCYRANFLTLGTALDEPRQTGAECQISAERDYWCRRDPKP